MVEGEKGFPLQVAGPTPMARPKLRVRVLMLFVALLAVALGGWKLSQRGAGLRREAARHAVQERAWTVWRGEYREVLADMRNRGHVGTFYFRSVLYQNPERWEEAMGEIIDYHTSARLAYELETRHPWEAVQLPPRPRALIEHEDVEMRANAVEAQKSTSSFSTSR